MGGFRQRVRFAPAVLATAALGSAALGLSTTGTFSAFTASITNSANTAAEGTIVMQESSGSVTCTSTDAGANSNDINTNASTCSTINKFGGSMTLTPGTAGTATVAVKNIGTAPVSSFTLAPTGSGCQSSNVGSTPGSATDICSQMDLVVTGGSSNTSIYSGKVGSFTSRTIPMALIPTAGGAAVSFTFTVTLPTTAGNTYQGKQVTLPLLWSFSS